MMQNRKIACLSMLIVSLMLAVGCQLPAPTKPAEQAPSAQMDPCAERLHDLCGPLLLYYAAYKELPESLAELAKLEPGVPESLDCPTSHEPYVYSPDGVFVNGLSGLLIVYDATPAHAGARWGITAEPPRPGRPLVLRVVRPQEAAIVWPEPQTQPAAP